MLSALIRSAGRQPAVPLAGQLAHESCVRPGPLVLGTAPLKSPTPVEDRDRHDCYRRQPCAARWARSFLPGSACRHAGRTISSPLRAQLEGVRHMVSEDSGCDVMHPAFPADCPHRMDFHCSSDDERVPPDTRGFQHIAEFIDSAESTVSRRSKPSSRTALMGEQPNPWKILHLQDATSRHRGAKPCRRCGRLGKMSLLSPGYLLSVNRPRFHMPRPGH
jgi:hypothetical protein